MIDQTLPHAFPHNPKGPFKEWACFLETRRLELGLTLEALAEKSDCSVALIKKARNGDHVTEPYRIKIVTAINEQWKADNEKKDKIAWPRYDRSSNSGASPIPRLANPYIAQPYLFHPRILIGRSRETTSLTSWLKRQEHKNESIYLLIAMGGGGKTALCWEFFRNIVDGTGVRLDGRLWWSFQQIYGRAGEDNSFGSFVTHALAYVLGVPESEVRKWDPKTQEKLLLRQLDERPFLLVLDGLEQILLGYAPPSVGSKTLARTEPEMSFRECIDPRHNHFLQQLARVHASRILITSRHVPSSLDSDCANVSPAAVVRPLEGLADDDAFRLWKVFDVGGKRAQLLPVFWAFGNCPLLIKILARAVVNFRPAPKDYDSWRTANPRFTPSMLSQEDAKSHVIDFALRRLTTKQRRVLSTMAMLRMPANWETLLGLLVNANERRTVAAAICRSEKDLATTLAELDNRDLLGWERGSNRYEIHPVVRLAIEAGMSEIERRKIAGQLCSYFHRATKSATKGSISTHEELQALIEQFSAYVALNKHEKGLDIFHRHIERNLIWRLGRSRDAIRLLDHMKSQYPLKSRNGLSLKAVPGTLYSSQAMAYQMIGELHSAAEAFRKAIANGVTEMNDMEQRIPTDYHLAVTVWWTGNLAEGETIARRGVLLARKNLNLWLEGRYLWLLAVAHAARGEFKVSSILFERVKRMLSRHGGERFDGVILSFLAWRSIWMGRDREAYGLAEKARQLIGNRPAERDEIRAGRLCGQAAIALRDWSKAEQYLRDALRRARLLNFVEEELPALTALADLHRNRGDFDGAYELLDQVWPIAERGPYPILHADARLVLSAVERDQNHREVAIQAAMRGYELAWCDGPPFSYHSGLGRAKKLLRGLGASAPKMTLNHSKIQTLPEIDLNPTDEFHVQEEHFKLRQSPHSTGSLGEGCSRK